jgi:hypothetical protein
MEEKGAADESIISTTCFESSVRVRLRIGVPRDVYLRKSGMRTVLCLDRLSSASFCFLDSLMGILLVRDEV